MIVYFTATGNSRYCAKFLAGALGDRCTDVFPYLRSGQAAELHSDTPWVFVTPTYSWQIPHVFAQLLRRSRLSGSRDAYFIMTCGNDIGNAAKTNRALCAQLGLRDRGTQQVVMPENYVVMFRAPGPDKAREIVRAAAPALGQAAACIRAGRDLPETRVSLLDRFKSGPVNRGFYRFQIRDKCFAAGGGCTGCGRCAAVCPLGNIRLEGGKPVWDGRCTHCMACLCGCPAGAIEYGRATRGKVRYQCPQDGD